MSITPLRLKSEKGKAADTDHTITPADGDYVLMLDADGSEGLEYPKVARFDDFNGAAFGDLTETQICNSGTNSLGTTTYFAAMPAADQYLYLVGQGTGNATYTAGRFMIEMWGT